MALELARKRDRGDLAAGEAAAAKLFATEALGRVADRILQVAEAKGIEVESRSLGAIYKRFREQRKLRLLAEAEGIY